MVALGSAAVAIILCLLVLMLAALAVPIVAIIDAAKRPDKEWQAAGVSRELWIILIAGGTFFLLPVGFAVAVYYLAAMRPRLDTAHDPFAR
jgi:hypothetical protein